MKARSLTCHQQHTTINQSITTVRIITMIIISQSSPSHVLNYETIQWQLYRCATAPVREFSVEQTHSSAHSAVVM